VVVFATIEDNPVAGTSLEDVKPPMAVTAASDNNPKPEAIEPAKVIVASSGGSSPAGMHRKLSP